MSDEFEDHGGNVRYAPSELARHVAAEIAKALDSAKYQVHSASRQDLGGERIEFVIVVGPPPHYDAALTRIAASYLPGARGEGRISEPQVSETEGETDGRHAEEVQWGSGDDGTS